MQSRFHDVIDTEPQRISLSLSPAASGLLVNLLQHEVAFASRLLLFCNCISTVGQLQLASVDGFEGFQNDSFS